MHTKVSKWGNSLAVRIPAALAEEARIADGDEVEIAANGRGLTISVATVPLRLSDLLPLITDESLHEPVDFGPPVGNELL